jgi:PmbA protein
VIPRLLDALAGRVAAADVTLKTDDVLTVGVGPGGDTCVSGCSTRTSHLRVLLDGRIGCASAADEDPAELAARALAAAASGEALELHLPAPSPLPEVATRSPPAAAAPAEALKGLARGLAERLSRRDRRVETWAERSAGTVQVANTRDVRAAYHATLAGVGAVVESLGPGAPPPIRVQTSAAALPELGDVEALVTEVERRLAPAVLEWTGPRFALLPVCFAPRAAVTLLRPLRAALLGRAAWLGRSPLRGRLGEIVFSERLSVTDDPLAPGRPGSRPLDDEGVPSRRLTLIDRGRLVAFACDLRTGLAAGVPSTGHAWRLPDAVPRVGFTNFLVGPGAEPRTSLLGAMSKGLLVEDLEWGPGLNPLGGVVAFRAPWAYLVDGGEVQGRVEGVTLSTNVFESLAHIRGIGDDATWLGSQCLPSLLLEGIGVTVTA